MRPEIGLSWRNLILVRLTRISETFSAQGHLALISRSAEVRQVGNCNAQVKIIEDMNRYVSDELTHFVGRSLADDQSRYNLLLTILRGRWLRPSYQEELGVGFIGISDGGKPLSGNEAIKTTSVCFCDIPVETLGIHIRKYGPFGIALPKHYLVGLGASPVHYVALNAKDVSIGIGASTVGARFDQFRREVQEFVNGLSSYVEQHDGRPKFLFKLSRPNTPPGHRLMGTMSSIQSDLELLLFGQLKFFNSARAEDDPDNFYMEREWRVPAGVSFRIEQIVRLILPERFVRQFREDLPSFSGDLITAESVSQS